MAKAPERITGMWKVEDCDEKRGFVCKRNIGEWTKLLLYIDGDVSKIKIQTNFIKTLINLFLFNLLQILRSKFL